MIQIRNAIDLLAARIPKETISLMYERIKNEFEDEDLAKALDDAVDAGSISYPSLLRSLRKYASIRREQEEAERKRKEEEEAKAFWRANYKYIKEGICNRECYSCKVNYCDVIAKHAIESVKDILNKHISVVEANKKLADMFKGIGFEDEIPELQPF